MRIARTVRCEPHVLKFRGGLPGCMTIAGDTVSCLFIDNSNTVLFPFFITKFLIDPIKYLFYLLFPVGKVFRVFHHEFGKSDRVDLRITPAGNVFKKRPPLVVLQWKILHPSQDLVKGLLVQLRFTSLHFLQLQK